MGRRNKTELRKEVRIRRPIEDRRRLLRGSVMASSGSGREVLRQVASVAVQAIEAQSAKG